MRVGIHQPNFVPHFGFFYKMSMCDLFVILEQVQFEKGGYQNRYYLQGKKRWITMPVQSGLEPIYKKVYASGQPLSRLNTDFIFWMRDVLSINTQIKRDVYTNSRGTQRLIDNLNYYGATTYVTSPSAKEKYLDEEAIRKTGIDIEYSSHPLSNLNIMEMLEEYGIEGTRAQLWKPKTTLCSNTQTETQGD